MMLRNKKIKSTLNIIASIILTYKIETVLLEGLATKVSHLPLFLFGHDLNYVDK